MSKKLFIPEIGTEIPLAQDWTFRLFFESRNISFFEQIAALNLLVEDNFKPTEKAVICYGYYSGHNTKSALLDTYYKKYFQYDYHQRSVSESACFAQGVPYCYMMTLPKGSVLAIDRVYIRKNNEEFSSITFRTPKVNIPKFKKHPRFWAPLSDVNNIEMEDVSE